MVSFTNSDVNADPMILASSQWNWWLWQSPADLFETWKWVNWLLRDIILVLMVMLAHTIFTTVIVAVRYAVAIRQTRRFARVTEESVASGRLEEVLASAETFKRSHMAVVIRAGLRAFRSTHSLTAEE